ELAELIADRMGTRVEPFFFRTDVGRRALRPTLVAGRCDMFIGLPHATDRGPGATIALTRPFLEVGYAVVAPPTVILRSLAELEPAIPQLAAKYHFPLDAPVDLAPAGKRNPFRGDASAVAAGRTLFNTHCSHCHSPNAANPEPRTDLRRLSTRYGAHADQVF